MSVNYSVFIKITFTFGLFTKMVTNEVDFSGFFCNVLGISHLFDLICEEMCVTRYHGACGGNLWSVVTAIMVSEKVLIECVLIAQCRK